MPLKLVLLAGWAAVLALAERARPAAPRAPGSDRPRWTRNLALWAANAAMNPLLTLPIVVAATQFDVWSRPDLGAWGVALDILALDLWAWAWHRANHVAPFLWRFHEVHHRDAFLDVTSAVRFHPGEVLISALARTPLLVALDVDLATVLVYDAVLTAAALFHHSNVRLPEKLEARLRAVLVTPSHHWVHHHAVRADTDSNYGVLLTLWDRLFRTWSPTARTPAMKIGAEGVDDLPLPALALQPFRPRAASPRNPPATHP
jgi:sterol desaturase/sphingolipid hydroxylase (fatty acid hydroxylase superfamily)